MDTFYCHINKEALRLLLIFISFFSFASSSWCQEVEDDSFDTETLNSVAYKRYSSIEKNNKVGIYDSLKGKSITPVDMDYLEFSHAAINSNGDTICTYYFEKGLQYGHIEINMSNNETIITSSENPNMVARLDSCSSIDNQMSTALNSMLKNTLAANSATYGQIAIIDVATGLLRSWVAIGKNNGSYRDSLLLKKSCTPQIIMPLMATMFLQQEGLNLDDSIDTGNGVLDVGNGVVIRDDSIIGATTWQEAFECHSNVALYKLLKNVGYEDFAVEVYRKLNRKAKTSNVMDIAAMVNGICNMQRVIIPTLKGNYRKVTELDSIHKEMNKMAREFFIDASRKCENLPDYTHRGNGAIGLYNSVLLGDSGSIDKQYETSFAGLYPMFKPKYAIAFFMDTPQKVTFPEDKNLAVIDSIINWMYEYRLVMERLDVVNEIFNNMVPIKGGSFTMLIENDERQSGKSKGRRVHVGDFEIGKYEVTQRKWEAVMGTVWSGNISPNHPVVEVNWDDCQKFINRLNEVTAMNFRLPTEAEWHFAASGGNKSHGYKYAGGNNIDSVAWYEGNNDWETHDVGLKAPNELGLYDMT